MDTVTEVDMAIAIAQLGGLGVIHKNLPIALQAQQIQQVKLMNLLVAAAVGIANDTKQRIEQVLAAGADIIVIDTAHGHSKAVIELAQWLSATHPMVEVIAGNIGTAEAALALKDAGVAAVKVGLGAGSICTTRIVSGVGVPQFSAIMNVAEALKGTDIKIIADGGIRYSGDITKAIAAGADTIMLGSLLAGTDEAPGEMVIVNAQQFKKFRGMGSLAAMQNSADRYFQHNVEQRKLVPEGVEATVPYKGSLSQVLAQLTGGLRSGMGYLGCNNIEALRGNVSFIKISPAAVRESHPHSIQNAKAAPNYNQVAL